MIEIFNCDQNTPEWFEARKGLATGSEFGTVQAVGRNGGESKTRRTYMFKLAYEKLTGKQYPEKYTNPDMERGHAWEDDARQLYSLITGEQCERVGFVRNGDKGCSPDSLIAGSRGMLEIKTGLPHIVIDAWERDAFPIEHKPQLQGGLWVCEREWIDGVLYNPDLPLFRKRMFRDEKYIAELAKAVEIFNQELAAVVDRMRRRYGDLEAA